jgi:hypothetical protein
MDNKTLLKTALILGGGFLLFTLVRPKDKSTKTDKKSADGEKPTPTPTAENAEIVMKAYTDALKNGEPPARLTELNKECMTEFGLRCYLDTKTGTPVVCDAKGQTILTK